MFKNQKQDFDNIVGDILNNKEFKELNNELHHGVSRYSHSLRVAKVTYKCSKLLNLKYKDATRAALMHDFYHDVQLADDSSIKKLSCHPEIASDNASRIYDINELETNIIKSHMFPVCETMPRYAESWLVSLCDKGVAIYEMYRFKSALWINIWLLFIFNIITIQK